MRDFAEDNYNEIDTAGARAQLRINLGENWTVTPSSMYQRQDQEGSWADDLINGNPDQGTSFRETRRRAFPRGVRR